MSNCGCGTSSSSVSITYTYIGSCDHCNNTPTPTPTVTITPTPTTTTTPPPTPTPTVTTTPPPTPTPTITTTPPPPPCPCSNRLWNLGYSEIFEGGPPYPNAGSGKKVSKTYYLTGLGAFDSLDGVSPLSGIPKCEIEKCSISAKVLAGSAFDDFGEVEGVKFDNHIDCSDEPNQDPPSKLTIVENDTDINVSATPWPGNPDYYYIKVTVSATNSNCGGPCGFGVNLLVQFIENPLP